MPEDSAADGLVSRLELEALAALYDASENAIDPTAMAAWEAESQFEARVLELYERVRLVPAYQSIDRFIFKTKLRTLCRQHLRRN